MNAITVVKPKNGSKKFYTEANFITEDVEGNRVVSKPFRGERFPKSFQGFRPNFNEQLTEWSIDMSDEDLDRLVKKCRFMHMKGPNKGTYITEADRHNRYDAFFNHEKLTVTAEEGKATFNGSPVHEIVLAGMRKDPHFLDLSAGGISHGRPADVKYELRSEHSEVIEDSAKIDIALEASELFSLMTFDKMLIIARGLELEVTDDIKPESLRRMLYKEGVMNDKSRNEYGQTYQQAFVTLAKTAPDKLFAINVFAKAKRKGLIRKYSGEWKFQGDHLGTEKEQIINMLCSDEGLEMLDKIESAVNAKR